ncbi:hypothetical protein BTO30_08745 [Domibacillus antri]|uniref:Uncharacterized protein n=1 Tax=Domibacillus antri TaxID=1714264 RepID=A0A1Q8Q5I4_9BACI|nr:hypothetical protein [Domibacillus antri]OLN22606.1 hypothetical protein BTO30_08745 [Domibacillus antri]
MIEKIWTRIIECEGEIFTQKKGKEFSYSIKGNTLFLSTTNRSISKQVIEHALEFVPLEKKTPLQHLQAPSYLYGNLMDDRIRKHDW